MRLMAVHVACSAAAHSMVCIHRRTDNRHDRYRVAVDVLQPVQHPTTTAFFIEQLEQYRFFTVPSPLTCRFILGVCVEGARERAHVI